MELKQEVLKRLGKKDGYDERRWTIASNLSQELDIHINVCFETLINLENKGLVQINI